MYGGSDRPVDDTPHVAPHVAHDTHDTHDDAHDDTALDAAFPVASDEAADAAQDDRYGEAADEAAEGTPAEAADLPTPPTTGDTAVDDAMTLLAQAQAASFAERIEAGERAHRALQGRLDDLGGA
jgi:hypothetical protein